MEDDGYHERMCWGKTFTEFETPEGVFQNIAYSDFEGGGEPERRGGQRLRDGKRFRKIKTSDLPS